MTPRYLSMLVAGLFICLTASQPIMGNDVQLFSETPGYEVSLSFPGGNGTRINPYQITNISLLQEISSDLTANYTIMNDINASQTSGWNGGAGFLQLAGGNGNFTGFLEGNGRTISNLVINRSSEDGVGIFGSMNHGRISNITISDSVINGKDIVGGFIGYLYNGTIFNCTFSGTISGANDTGGLVGICEDAIIRCTFRGDVLSSGRYYYRLGGIVGTNYGDATHCNVDGNVMVLSYDMSINYIGGFAGRNYGTISSSDVHGNISGKGESSSGMYFVAAVGGFTGKNDGTLIHCTYEGNVSAGGNGSFVTSLGGFTGLNKNGNISNCSSIGTVRAYSDGGIYVNIIGGLVGDNEGGIIANCHSNTTILGSGAVNLNSIGGLVGYQTGGEVFNCFSYGNITGMDSEHIYMLGGLVGMNKGKVTSSYSTADIYAISKPNKNQATWFGGLIGLNRGPVYDSYSTGKVEAYALHVQSQGGSIGLNDNRVFDCFFDMQTSGKTTGIGGGNLSGVTGLNTSEMIYRSTYTNASWDFTATWKMVENETYPTHSRIYRFPQIEIEGPLNAYEDAAFTLEYDTLLFSIEEKNIITDIRLNTNGSSWLDLNRSTGSITGTPGDEDIGSIWANITIVDLYGNSGSSNITINVVNVNDPPMILTENNGSAVEDSLYSVDYDFYDPDPTSDEKIWHLSTNATWLSINSTTGVLEGTPRNNDVGTQWANITIRDGYDGSDQTNFTIVVNNTNDDPIITTSDVLFTLEDQEYRIEYNATDVDPTNDTLSWSLWTNASWLSMNSTSALLNGTPLNEHVGTFWVNVSVGDGIGGSDRSNFTLTVTNQNDDPVITTSDVLTTLEDLEYRVAYNATDVDPTNDILTWSLWTNATWLSMDPASGILNGTPLNEHVGTYWVNVSVRDGFGASDHTNFTFVVNNTNDDPIITAVPITSVLEDTSVYLDFPAEDVDPTDDHLDLSLTTDSSCITLVKENNTLLISPENRDVGTYWVNVSVSDGRGGHDHLNFTIEVINVNDDPTITTVPITSVLEDNTIYQAFLAEDMDPTEDLLSFSMITNSTGVTFNTGNNTMILSPENPDVGTFWVNITVSDGRGGMAWINYTLTVLNVNDDPEITSDDVTECLEDQLYTVNYTAYDMDPTGDELRWDMFSSADFLSMDGITGELSGTPENPDVGAYWVNISVEDGKGGKAWRNFSLIVANTNDLPTMISTTQEWSIDEDSSITMDLLSIFLDVDGEDLEFSFQGSENLTLTIDDTTLSIIPDQNWSGTETITLYASDNVGSTPFPLTITVNSVNDAPTVTSVEAESTYIVGGDQWVSVIAEDIDAGDQLSYRWVSNISGEIGTGPSINLSLPVGRHLITVTATDMEGESAEYRFDVVVLDEGEEKGEVEEDGPSIVLIAVGAIFLIIIGVLLFLLLSRKNEGPAEE